MIEYANDSVIKALRQYDMLSKSLKLITDTNQRSDICLQMTKIIEHVLDITNEIYEDKYKKIINKTTCLMDEEKDRLLEIINLVNERRAYVNNQISNNREITGISFSVNDILGEDKLDFYKNQLKVIEKYKSNLELDSVLKQDIITLDRNIKKAQDKISNNQTLNKQLEDKMIKLLDKAFNVLGLYELQERSKEIDLAYTELGYSLEIAKENAKIARRDCTEDIIVECDNMLASNTLEYERYKEKKLILKLIEIFKRPCSNYEELLSKREEMNILLNGIINSELYKEVGRELNKEYATIKLESQDAATLESLVEEREKKSRTLEEIKSENESEEFKTMLANLLENEKRHQEELLQEKKKQEAIEREKQREKKKLMQEEMLKRQRILEEERKKEIERRTKQLLVEKKKPVLLADKEDKNKTNISNAMPNIKSNDINISRSKNGTTSKAKRVGTTPKAEKIRTVPKPEKNTDTRNTSFRNNPNYEMKREARKISNNKLDTKNNTRPSPNNTNNTTPKINHNLEYRSKREYDKNIQPNNNQELNLNNNHLDETIFKKPQTNKEDIAIIKSDNFNNNIVDVKEVNVHKNIFPEENLNKEEDIFPEMPTNDSFFDEDEFKDLNKFVDDDKDKNWF